MTTTTVSAARFALDETKAAEWIAHVIAHYEGDADDCKCTLEMADLSHDYSAADDTENGSGTRRLVEAAQDAGIITDAQAPKYPALSLNFIPFDGESEGYSWELNMGSEANAYLTDGFHEFSGLGYPDLKGAELALAVLREATSAGNGLTASIGRYVSALPLAVRAPEIGRLLESIKTEIEEPGGSWNGGDVCQMMTDWFTALGFDIEAPMPGADDEMACSGCGDVVATLSTRYLCDGCEEEADAS